MRGRRRSTVRLAAAGVALVAATVLSACNPSMSPWQRSAWVNGSPRCEVGVVGDSLAVGARDLGGLRAKLARRGCTVTEIDARTSRSTAAGADVVERWARSNRLPRVLVVALGTNDCNRRTVLRHGERLLAAAGPQRSVVWLTTYRKGCDAAVNSALAELQRRRGPGGGAQGNLWIVDQHGWLAAEPALLARDGVHLSTAGYARMADRIAAAVVK